MSEPEFSRRVETARLGSGARRLTANSGERAALAERFGLVAIDRLEAEIALEENDGTITASGRLLANIVQSCAVSGEDLAVSIDEPLTLRFVPAAQHRPDEELELSEEDCDEIEYDGHAFDLGEAVAQSLALAIDPFATGPEAERARAKAGLLAEEDAGPFAALKGLAKKD